MARFSRTQRYPDDYEEDSYPVLPSRMHDLRAEEDDDRSRPMESSLPGVQRQYTIGRGPPPGHGRSMSIHYAESPNTNTQAAGRQSWSAHMPDLREASGVDAPIRMGDLEALFHRFSLQQEEGQREITQRLEARLTSLEHRSHAPSSDSFNGALATTGTNRVMRPRAAGGSPTAAPVVFPESDEGSIARGDSAGAASQEEENADDEADGPKNKKKPKYHTAIQKYTTITFHGACGVQGPNWPETAVVRVNPATGVTYLSPFFECDVTDPRNHAICVAIAGTVDREMNDNRPPGVPETAVWDSKLLLKCAKQSFRTCKASWKKVHDAEAAKRAAINDRNTRRYRRRCTKFEHIDSQVDAYAAKLRVPRSVVADLFTQELLSDEASGPEDEADETFEAWKVCMVAAAGHKNLTAVALKKEHFVEVLECPWRSDELSIISSSMQTLYTRAFNAGSGASVKYTRVPTPTHRKSSLVPRIAPWDFGISSQWLAEQRNDPEVADSLFDWGTHGNPKGCKWEDVRIVRIDATGEKVVDSHFDFEGLAETEQ